MRAIDNRKRGLTPSSQAGMQAPLMTHELAHLRPASEPSPPRSRSMTPLTVATGSASPIPAGLTLGQAATHLPQRVQASTISSTRPCNADSNVTSFIADAYRSRVPRRV
jgi:hypothetical protein